MLVTVDEILWERLTMNGDEENCEDFLIENVRKYRENEIDWENEIAGEMSGGHPVEDFSSFWNFDSEETCEVILAEIPTGNPWEIFAWLPMGGWNDCPDTSEMIGTAKYWHGLYGAVPAALSHDELEFYVKEPVGDKSRAMNLAFEQYAFCPDRVDQCEEDGSIGKLADGLTKSSLWYFWWD